MTTPATILLVEDDPDIRRAMELILTRRGHIVHTATDPAGTIAQAQAHDPDVIVLDVVLPGGCGLDLCRALRSTARTAATPVVFVSARATTEDVHAGLAAGGADYVTKPFGITDLVHRVEALLPVSPPAAAVPAPRRCAR